MKLNQYATDKITAKQIYRDIMSLEKTICIYGHLIYDISAIVEQWERVIFFKKMVLSQLDIHMENNES